MTKFNPSRLSASAIRKKNKIPSKTYTVSLPCPGCRRKRVERLLVYGMSEEIVRSILQTAWCDECLTKEKEEIK